MIDLPKTIAPSVTAPVSKASTSSTVQFHAVSDEEVPPIVAIERRRTPSRRKRGSGKQQIERRVSSDRRRSMFSRKA